MGIKDKKGKIVSNPQKIKDIYVSEYKHRMRHRPMNPSLKDIEDLQNKLFHERLQISSQIKSPDWTLAELQKVLKSLKLGKSRDPSGLICDIFKPEVGFK